jgi:hypothetical protein
MTDNIFTSFIGSIVETGNYPAGIREKLTTLSGYGNLHNPKFMIYNQATNIIYRPGKNQAAG